MTKNPANLNPNDLLPTIADRVFTNSQNSLGDTATSSKMIFSNIENIPTDINPQTNLVVNTDTEASTELNAEENEPVIIERDRRWRLILGKDENEQGQQKPQDQLMQQEAESAEGSGESGDDEGDSSEGLSDEDQAMDDALDSLYGEGDMGGSADSQPDIARWLGDIHRYFPDAIVQVMQQDILKKLNLRKILSEPELLKEIKPNMELVSKILMLNSILPAETKETARQIVQQLVDELKEKLEYPLLQAINGSLNRSIKIRNPRKHKDINWYKTIHANLKHYMPDKKTVVPEQLIGYGKQRSSLHDVVLCIDQSGSMSKSVVYASIFGSVMASLPAIDLKLILFDTAVVDMTDKLQDPVEMLFGIRLRGGTNIDRALTYCQQNIGRPKDTVMVLISDLFEGGNKDNMKRRAAELVSSGVNVIVLLALSDDGAPRYDKAMAADLAALGIPCFACTPKHFPDLMGTALSGHDVREWASSNNIGMA